MDRIDALTTAMRDLGVPVEVAEGLTKVVVHYARSSLQVSPDGKSSPALLDRRKPPASLELLAKKLHRQSLKRSDLLGELSHDPAWNMLLALIAENGGHGPGLTVSNLCYASGVPPTTALRHIQAMVAQGLIEKVADQADGRRIWAQITEQARKKMVSLLRDYSPNTPIEADLPSLFLS